MNPGSNVKIFRSLVKLEMLTSSGPMVPDLESSCVDLPVARFFSSYFVLMRFSDRLWYVQYATRQPCTVVQGNQGHTSCAQYPARRGRREAAGSRPPPEGGDRRSLREMHARSRAPRMRDQDGRKIRPSQRPPRTSYGTCPRVRRYPQPSACRYRTDGSSNKPRPAGPDQWS